MFSLRVEAWKISEDATHGFTFSCDQGKVSLEFITGYVKVRAALGPDVLDTELWKEFFGGSSRPRE